MTLKTGQITEDEHRQLKEKNDRSHFDRTSKNTSAKVFVTEDQIANGATLQLLHKIIYRILCEYIWLPYTYKQSVCYLHFGLILVAPGYGHFIVSITRTLWKFGLVTVTGCWGIFYWSWQILQEKWWMEYIMLAKFDHVTNGQILCLWDCNILPLLHIIWPKEHISFNSFWYNSMCSYAAVVSWYT